ncbi:unnamed protein product [Trichobilharzia regenti]|nr:unnamed protein product [Trichobilharzia regenti]
MEFILLSVVPLALVGRDAYIEKIFKMHNEYRQQLLECKIWDEELAGQAKALSKSCRSSNKSPTSRKFNSVGQNIASCGTVESVIESWFNQHVSYDFKNNRCTRRCGQYLQMVFENTTHIGCGVTECPQKKDNGYVLLVVCNYGPGANFSVRPYEAKDTGKFCSMKGNAATVQPKKGRWTFTKINRKFKPTNK